jgi:hypothetical protein
LKKKIDVNVPNFVARKFTTTIRKKLKGKQGTQRKLHG